MADCYNIACGLPLPAISLAGAFLVLLFIVVLTPDPHERVVWLGLGTVMSLILLIFTLTRG